MERLRCLPTVRAVDDSSDEVGEWIPSRKDAMRVCKVLSVRISRKVCDIIPASRKSGRRTFVEGCFDAVLLLACWAGNVPVVSYLLMSYILYFSIDTLIDKLSVRKFKYTPALYGSKGMARFEQLKNDKISLLHAAAEGMQLDVVKLLLLTGANVNNPSKWLISPLISALISA